MKTYIARKKGSNVRCICSAFDEKSLFWVIDRIGNPFDFEFVKIKEPFIIPLEVHEYEGDTHPLQLSVGDVDNSGSLDLLTENFSNWKIFNPSTAMFYAE